MAHTVDGVILFQINSDCVWTIGIVTCLYSQVYAVAMVYSTRPKTPCRLKECLANILSCFLCDQVSYLSIN